MNQKNFPFYKFFFTGLLFLICHVAHSQNDTLFICAGTTLDAEYLGVYPPDGFASYFRLFQPGYLEPVAVSDTSLGTWQNYHTEIIYHLQTIIGPASPDGTLQDLHSPCNIETWQKLVFLRPLHLSAFIEDDNGAGSYSAVINISGGITAILSSSTLALTGTGLNDTFYFDAHSSLVINFGSVDSMYISYTITDAAGCMDTYASFFIPSTIEPQPSLINCNGIQVNMYYPYCDDYNPFTTGEIINSDCICSSGSIPSFCPSAPGFVNTDSMDLCPGESPVISHIQGYLAPSDTMFYVLHDSPNSTLGPIIKMGNIEADFINTGNNLYGVHYLSALVTTKTAEGLPDMDSPCLFISPGTPINYLGTSHVQLVYGYPQISYDNYGNTQVHLIDILQANPHSNFPITISSEFTEDIYLFDYSPIFLSLPYDSLDYYEYGWPSLVLHLTDQCMDTDNFIESLGPESPIELGPYDTQNSSLPYITGMPDPIFGFDMVSSFLLSDYYICDQEEVSVQASTILLPCGEEDNYTVSYALVSLPPFGIDDQSLTTLSFTDIVAFSNDGHFSGSLFTDGNWAIYGLISPALADGSPDYSNPSLITYTINPTTFEAGASLDFTIQSSNYNNATGQYTYCFNFIGNISILNLVVLHMNSFGNYTLDYANHTLCIWNNEPITNFSSWINPNFSCYHAGQDIISIHTDSLPDCPLLSQDIGSPCISSDVCSINTTIQSDCTCGGGSILDEDNDGICDSDSADTCSGPNVGEACISIDLCFINTTIQSDCTCGGGSILDEDNDGICDSNSVDTCNGPNIGDPCISAELCFINTTIQSDCTCGGGSILDEDNDGICDSDSTDTCSGPNVGEACDDGNNATHNDMVMSDCTCSGVTGTYAPEEGILLYPNPATQYLYIQYPGNLFYVLTDLSGKTILNGHGTRMELGNIASGIYLLKISTEDKTSTWKKVHILH